MNLLILKQIVGWILAGPAALVGLIYLLLTTLLTPFAIGILILAGIVDQNKDNVLPNTWFQLFNTPDAPGSAQGMDEDQVKALYNWLQAAHTFTLWRWMLPWFPTFSEKTAWYIKTFYWLGIRNQVYGLTQAIAPRIAANQVQTLGDAVYPRNNPYTPGFQVQYSYWGWIVLWELAWIASDTETKFSMLRLGWKVQTVAAAGGPVVPLFQFKAFLTK